MEDKQEQILNAIKQEAEALRYGELLIRLKIQDKRILAGEIIETHKKLG